MTDQEIEKLREKLGDGFEVAAGYNCAVITVKDIWKGVEFAECLEDALGYEAGKIYPVTGFSNENQTYFVNTLFDEFGSPKNGMCKAHAKPSTEAAYVEQLKAKAKELYGEIKDGDRFELDGVEFIAPIGFELRYVSEHDKLVLDNYMKCPHIYKQGKWAKKIQQAIVTPIEIHSEEPDIVGDQSISIVMKIIHGHISQKNRVCVAYHLAKCLEDYLNKSQ